MTNRQDHPGLPGTVALVTGAARGIGAAVATALGRVGMIMAGVDVRDEPWEGRAEPITRHLADVRDPGQVDAVVGRIENELGPIGVLVNVAGVLRTDGVADFSAEHHRMAQTYAAERCAAMLAAVRVRRLLTASAAHAAR
ncbi:SDR family NAD(P)-dependent oxidoreductase [Streptosporangium sp. NBC_01755]|uniref:SDR family NAD(P)-dependent oxidoreductase n=1 Tax=Streptosporangium sp. NBC_01755 TaxID=2975949 RepID=UPI002DDA7211|nr:SDR family NAD(P)-dependent oxidoreductase [Streptosporangium sp. NBC_01755]WSC99643.1 SDR family NAD(P)-dependent oxidoreductase [Streptosporangium sp. NBC_01755]